MPPTLLIALTLWIGLNAALLAALLSRPRRRPRRRRIGVRRRCWAAPVDGYGSLLLSRLVIHTCRVVGTPEACLLLRDVREPDTLVPVAARGLDEGLIGRRIPTPEAGWRLELVAADGTPRHVTSGVAVPVARGAVGDCGYLWAAATDGAQLGDRQLRLLAELAELCGRTLDDLDSGVLLDDAIGRALALLGKESDPAAAGRRAALARAVGERLGLDAAALIELDVAARVQHAVPIAPAAAVRAVPGFAAVAIVLQFTAERWDGDGPQGLRGDRIPLGSRILAVCGSLGVPFDETLRVIQGASGTAFDPAVVHALSQELLGPVASLEDTPRRWADDDRLFAV